MQISYVKMSSQNPNFLRGEYTCIWKAAQETPGVLRLPCSPCWDYWCICNTWLSTFWRSDSEALVLVQGALYWQSHHHNPPNPGLSLDAFHSALVSKPAVSPEVIGSLYSLRGYVHNHWPARATGYQSFSTGNSSFHEIHLKKPHPRPPIINTLKGLIIHILHFCWQKLMCTQVEM